mgnify:CR=1 FL=1
MADRAIKKISQIENMQDLAAPFFFGIEKL